MEIKSTKEISVNLDVRSWPINCAPLDLN